MIVRDERPSDIEQIDDLTRRAFEPMPYSDGSEAGIIRSLREAGDLTVSLVVEDHGKVVGHVAFSPVTIAGDHEGWFGLGPIAVEPDRQRGGIGRILVERGLEAMRQRGANGVALIGDPGPYRRFGFKSDGLMTYKNLNPDFVQRIVFCGAVPQGELRFAAAFEDA